MSIKVNSWRALEIVFSSITQCPHLILLIQTHKEPMSATAQCEPPGYDCKRGAELTEMLCATPEIKKQLVLWSLPLLWTLNVQEKWKKLQNCQLFTDLWSSPWNNTLNRVYLNTISMTPWYRAALQGSTGLTSASEVSWIIINSSNALKIPITAH